MDEKHAHNFVECLTQLADVVLFSAAFSHQGGTHHVNEQPPEYWANLFQKKDFLCFDFLRGKILYNTKICSWYRQNVLVFAHSTQRQRFENQGIFPVSSPAWVILMPKIRQHFLERDRAFKQETNLMFKSLHFLGKAKRKMLKKLFQ